MRMAYHDRANYIRHDKGKDSTDRLHEILSDTLRGEIYVNIHQNIW